MSTPRGVHFTSAGERAFRQARVGGRRQMHRDVAQDRALAHIHRVPGRRNSLMRNPIPKRRSCAGDMMREAAGAVCFHRDGFGALFISSKKFEDRKSTRLNSSHVAISYAVFCLKKKIQKNNQQKEVYTPSIMLTE